jgi:hypothetical protein
MAAGLTDRQHETAADRRLYVEIGFVPITCGACGIEALVKKNSQKHTSVQWTAAGVAGCPEITAARTADPPGLVLGCPKLADSIAAAVQDGTLVVPDAVAPDG